MAHQIEHNLWKGDFHSLPVASQTSIILSGLSHKGYNEVAAKVTAWKATEEGKTANDEAVAAKKAALTTDFISALTAGTLGTGHGGPRKDPMEAAVDEIVERELRIVLRNNGVSPLPKGRKDTVTFPGGTTIAYGDLLDRYLDGHDKSGSFGEKGLPNRPRIVREAERKVAADRKKAEGAAKVPKVVAQAPTELF